MTQLKSNVMNLPWISMVFLIFRRLDSDIQGLRSNEEALKKYAYWGNLIERNLMSNRPCLCSAHETSQEHSKEVSNYLSEHPQNRSLRPRNGLSRDVWNMRLTKTRFWCRDPSGRTTVCHPGSWKMVIQLYIDISLPWHMHTHVSKGLHVVC